MRLSRVVGLGLVVWAGYVTYKAVEVATRPMPPTPFRGVDIRGIGLPIDLDGARPEDADAFAERFAAVVERRMRTDGW